MKPYFLSLVFAALTHILFAQTSNAGDKIITNRDARNDIKITSIAQTDTLVKEQFFSRYNLGLGLGIDYGGIIGGRFTVLPVRQIFLFAGAGYNLAGIGYNVGTGVRLSPRKNFCPYIIAMYGYNAVIVVKDAAYLNKTYYGPSMGLGFEIRTANKLNYFNIEFLIPSRPKAFENDMDHLEEMGVQFTKPLPISLSLGYHMGFKSRLKERM